MVIEVTFDTTDVYISTTVSPVYVNVSFEAPAGGGGAEWGDITGTLSDQTDLQTALDLKVPYTGATTNVNLGEYEIKAGQVTLDTSPTGTAAVGTTRWNDTTGLTETTLKGGNVILKNGVDLVARVVNKVSPNTTLTKAAYQAVRVSGAQGQRLAVALAQANNDANSADTIGLVTETIATNQEGFIMTVGQLENINTTGSLQGETWVDGDVLYLSPTTAGAITKVKPTGNGHIVVIGYVEYAHANNGKIYVKVMNGWELDELHDVAIVTPLNNEALIYESATALWKNKSIATALGYTPANAATTLTINGVTFDLSANRTFTVGSVTGSGASGQVAYWDGTTSQAGSSNLVWDNANGRLGIGTNAPQGPLHINTDITLANNGFTITRTGIALADANFQITNGTNTAGQFLPTFISTSNIAGVGGFFSGRFTPSSTSDIGLVLESRTKAGAALSQGYIASFRSLATDYIRIAHNGNMLLQNGGTFTDSGQRLQVQGTTLLNGNVTFSSSTGMFWDATNSRLGIGTNAPAEKLHVAGNATYRGLYPYFELVPSGWSGGMFYLQAGVNDNGSTAGNYTVFFNSQTTRGFSWVQNSSPRMALTPSNNLIIQNGGTFTDSGERLQVTGTSKFAGNMTLSLNQNSATTFNVSNTTSGTLSQTEIACTSSNGVLIFSKNSALRTAYKILSANDGYIYNSTLSGDIGILNDFSTGNIKFAAGGSSTAHLTIKSNGRINMSSLPTSSTGLATGDLWNDAGTIKIV
jgi:hypothetical protein